MNYFSYNNYYVSNLTIRISLTIPIVLLKNNFLASTQMLTGTVQNTIKEKNFHKICYALKILILFFQIDMI